MNAVLGILMLGSSGIAGTQNEAYVTLCVL